MSSNPRLPLLTLASLSFVARAHAHDALALGADHLLSSWTPNHWLLGAIVAACLLYACGQRARTRRALTGQSPGRVEAGAFTLAMMTLLLALVSPLDRLSDLAFSAHMAQHELLMLLAAPLLVLARPLPTYLWALPRTARSRLAAVVRRPHVQRCFRILTAPLFALVLHGCVRWLWHMQRFFEAALQDEWIHGLQHATFFFSALLFWWGLVHGRYGRSGYGLSALFVLLTAMHTGALGALLSFGDHPWYPSYTQRARVYAIDPVADQQLAGLIMWVFAGLWLMLLGLALSLAWLGEARRRVGRGQVAALLRTRAGVRP